MRVTTGGRREVTAGGAGGEETGGIGGRKEVTMRGEEVTVGVSDDAGGIAGGSPSAVGKTGGGLVTSGVAEGTTAGGKDGAVDGNMYDDAGGVTREGPPSIGKDEGKSLSLATVATDGRIPTAKDRVVTEDGASCDAESVDENGTSNIGEDREQPVFVVVTDGGIAGRKDGTVTDDAEGVTRDVLIKIDDDVGLSVSLARHPPASNCNELKDINDAHDEVALDLVQDVLTEEDDSVMVVLDSNVDGDELDGVTIAPALVNGIADVVAPEAETILSSLSAESLATCCKSLDCLKA